MIDKAGKTIAEGYHGSNLYYIKAWINSTTENVIALKLSSESMNTKEVQDVYHLWHLRMGHLNDMNMSLLSKTVEGIPEGLTLSQENEVCDTCMYRKQARLPFEDSSSMHELMELVHSDICGPIRTVSLSGAKYIITFIDHFS